MKKLTQILALIALLFTANTVSSQISPQFSPIPPSYNINSNNPMYATSIPYDDIDTAYQSFHIFVPDTISSYPLIIFVHGGGFRAGSKDEIFVDVGLQTSLKFFLESGFAFATIDYRLLPPQGANYVDSVGVIKCLNDSKRALQFIRYHADDLFIDPARIGMKGGSAGAGVGLWLATRDDMSDPNSIDPVLQQSTRVCAAHVRGSQSTYDLYKWETEVYHNYDGLGSNYTADSMVQLLGFDRYSDFYGGLDSTYHILYDPVLIQYREDVDMLYHMSSDDAPLYIEHSSPAVHPSDDLLHHSLHGMEIYDAAMNASVPEVIAKIQAQGIDNSQGETGDEFLVRIVESCELSLSLENESELSSLKLYPNPVETELYVEGLKGDENLSLMSLSGQQVHKEFRNGSLDVTDLTSGVYLLIVESKSDRRVLKFVKNV